MNRVDVRRPSAARDGGVMPGRAVAPVLAGASNPGAMQWLGTFASAAFFGASISLINEAITRSSGVNFHLMTIPGLVCLVCALISTNFFRALQTRIGLLWVGLFAWLLLTVPFSSWKTGSLAYAIEVGPYHLVVLVVCAVAVVPSQVRIGLYGLVAGGFCLALTCLLLGTMEAGRLGIEGTSLTNPNELGFRLLLAFSVLVFPVASRGWAGKLIGGAGMLGMVLLIARTGSRGTLIALIGLTVVLFLVSSARAKLTIALASVVAAGIFLLATPAAALDRFSLLFADDADNTGGIAGPDSGSQLSANELEAARGSSENRKELLQRAIQMTSEHPVFGVGAGQFAQAMAGESQAAGVHVAALRPHNAYVLVSAELGIPGLILYSSALFLSIAASYRTYRRARKAGGDDRIAAQSLGLFAFGVAFALNTVFIHPISIADVGPVIALSLANALAAEQAWASPVPVLQRSFRSA